ncbi:Flp family type IVb pilin [uncultured Enterovirga sp.]|uniref:Flp family type IVb pilin n=1 Tax=uncultured Enterovirga sp. TaxID=2026352 RepID=UPI0035CABE82
MIGRWLKDRSGATAIEYGMIAALIAAVIIVSVAATGSGTNGLFVKVKTAFITYLP